jgi:transcriptional regulator with XRE-family HTH domain
LGQQQLAQLISLSRSSLANIEIGNHQPSIFTIYEIALALDCEIGDILPSKDRYNTSANTIDEKYVEIFNSLPDSMSEKNLLIFKKLLEKTKK